MSYNADWNKQRRERLRAQGLCYDCGKVPSVKSRCSDCNKKYSAINASKRKLRIEQGICAKCGKVPAVSGKQNCATCAKYYAARTKQLVAKRKTNGVCQMCGKPGLKTKTLCAACAAKLVTSVARIRAKRIAQGICILCGNNPSTKYTQMCRDCRSQNTLSREEREEQQEQTRLRKIAKQVAYAQWLKDNKPVNVKPKHWQVIELRFGLNDGQKRRMAAVGKIMGFTRQRVDQIEKHVLKQIAGTLPPLKKRGPKPTKPPQPFRIKRQYIKRKGFHPQVKEAAYFSDFYSGE